jgi:hypothetical protein
MAWTELIDGSSSSFKSLGVPPPTKMRKYEEDV